MKEDFRTAVRAIAVAMALVVVAAFPASAQFPDRPIKVVVPFAAAGVTDVVARVVFDHVSRAINQTIIIDNRPGAGGTIGIEQVAATAPDGYTLIMADPSGSLPANVTLYPALRYHPIRSLSPIAIFGNTGAVLLVSNELPVKTAQELVALAKSKPGQLTFASTGAGTPGHLNGELFSRLAGIKAVHVPYRIVGQAVTDLIAGRVSFWIAPIPTMLQNVRQKQLRPLAVAGDQRSSDLPGIADSEGDRYRRFRCLYDLRDICSGRYSARDRRSAPHRDQTCARQRNGSAEAVRCRRDPTDWYTRRHHQNA